MSDFNTEVRRQLFHMFWGVLFAFLIYLEIIDWKVLLVLGLIGLFLMLYIKWTGQHIHGISHLIRFMGRPEEVPGWGAFTFVIGALISVLLFPVEIAAASLMILGIGDSLSHIAGKFMGRIKTMLSKDKKLEGFFVGFITSFLGALVFVSNTKAIVGAFFAMFVEHWDFTDFMDDNILIPLTAGIAMTLLQTIIIL